MSALSPETFRTEASISWNVFRYIADYTHLFGVLCVILTLLRNNSCHGLSIRTQILYSLVFFTRYLDLWTTWSLQSTYLVVFKSFFLLSSAYIVIQMVLMRATLERSKDTFAMLPVLIFCTVLGVMTSSERNLMTTCWTFSEWLEAFAMVPQYIFSYRDFGNSDCGVTSFILAVGGYRTFYAMNWIYKRMVLGSRYSNKNSWIGGAIEILFFIDFVCSKFFNKNVFLRNLALRVDDKVNDIQEVIEMRVFGGPVRKRRQYDAQQNDKETTPFGAPLAEI